jgi:predicted alpha/beta hydrolase family esterase
MKVIFVPGWHDGGTDILSPNHKMWFGWLKPKLEELGIEVIADDYPDAWDCKASEWLPFISKLGADESTILIGHSTGAIAAMRFAEDNPILGSVLVGSYYTDLGDPEEKVSGYFNTPWRWQHIKDNQKWIIQFHSTDDPWIPNDEAQMIQNKLSTELHEFNDKGHFGVDKPFEEFPELLDVLKFKLQSN